MIEIKITTKSIKLEQALKLANVTQSGGEAKELIQNSLVSVNDEIETRRGRKLYDGDRINIQDHSNVYIIAEGL